MFHPAAPCVLIVPLIAIQPKSTFSDAAGTPATELQCLNDLELHARAPAFEQGRLRTRWQDASQLQRDTGCASGKVATINYRGSCRKDAAHNSNHTIAIGVFDRCQNI
jgi:hypothetical protein